MLCNVCDFVKRHRRKFYFTGAVLGGGWLLYKYLQKKIQEFREEEDKEYLDFARRQHHFDSNQRTCNMTVLSMLPNIRETLIQVLNTEEDTATLKTNPPNKLQLWDELKIKSFARSVSVVYGCCIMSLLLRAQLNIIGGYIYLDSLQSKNGYVKEQSRAPKEVQERYLSVIKYFFSQGLPDLTKFVQQAVAREVSNLSLKERLSLSNVQSLFTHIRERVECGKTGLASNIPTMPLCQYMMPGEQVPDIELVSREEQIYDQLINETRDILESTDFHNVLHSCLERGFFRLFDCLAEHYKHQAVQYSQLPQLNEATIPVAKLVPVVNGLMFKLCCDAPNPFIQELLLLEDVKTLAANIYEAFSQQEEVLH